MSRLQMTVNGNPVDIEVAESRYLSDVLREDLRLTGSKVGCAEAECGICTVLVDGTPIVSCVYPAYKAQGRSIETIEGLSKDGSLHALQQEEPIGLGQRRNRFTAQSELCRAHPHCKTPHRGGAGLGLVLSQPGIDMPGSGTALRHEVLREHPQHCQQGLRHLIVCQEIRTGIEILRYVMIGAIHPLNPAIYACGSLLHQSGGMIRDSS